MPNVEFATDFTPSKTVETLYHSRWLSSSMPYQVANELGLVDDGRLEIRRLPDAPDGLMKLHQIPELGNLMPVRRCLPLLVLPDGTTMVESAAIVLYFVNRYDKEGKIHPLLPEKPTQEQVVQYSHFYQGIIYAIVEVGKITDAAFEAVYNIKEEDRDVKKIEKIRKDWDTRVVGHLKHQMRDGRPYYLGEEYSAVDMMFAYQMVVARWLDFGLCTSDFEKKYSDNLYKMKTYRAIYCPDGE